MSGLQIGDEPCVIFYYNYLKNNIVLTVNDVVITSFCITITSVTSTSNNNNNNNNNTTINTK